MKTERQVLTDGQAWACVKRSWIVDKWTAYERPGEAVMDGGQMDGIHQLKVTSAACELQVSSQSGNGPLRCNGISSIIKTS